MARFVQIIEFQTARIEEIEALGRPSRTEGSTAPTFRRIMATADRDRPATYLTIVEFDSYDSAMENSGRPRASISSMRAVWNSMICTNLAMTAPRRRRMLMRFTLDLPP